MASTPPKARVASKKMSKGRGKSTGRLSQTPAGGTFRGWVRAGVRSVVIGAVLASGAVGGACYRHALTVVDAGTGAPAWSVPGHIWSAPIEVWSGMRMTPEELGGDLGAAGYARVTKATQPGDFQVSTDAVMVEVRKASGPGWETRAGPVLVTFAGGRVRSVTPGGRATLAPAVLATVRGVDNENRNPVPLAKIPASLRDAVVAIEDSRFYDHHGIDPVGLTRAMGVNLWRQELAQGGSTLTQQLAKNLFLTQARTAERKFDEVFLALALENRLSKDKILELYLNEIYLGQAGGSSVCGMDMAARAYFGKPVDRVTLAEAATLAGVIQSPNVYSPIRHPERARERRDVVLQRMVDTGVITAAERDVAKESALTTHAGAGDRRAPWAVDAVVATVEANDEGAIAARGLEVTTTIQPAIQRLAEQSVAVGMAELIAAHPKLAAVQIAMVAVRARDGAVVAMVGGRDYGESAFNRAIHSERQVGSTVKALTLLAAFELDPSLSPATRFDDAPLTRTHDGKDWTPANYDNTFVGPIPLRNAIAASRNIPAVLLAERVGLSELRTRLRALGLPRATNYPSVALGGFSATPLQLAGAYTPLAADGAFHAPFYVRAVRDRDNARILDNAPTKATTRYSPRATWLADDVLHSVMTVGTGKSAARFGVGQGAFGKSGTTDGYVDAWFVGVAGPYVVATWVGFDKDGKVGLPGSKAALPTWARFVDALGTDDVVAKMPDGISAVVVCEATGAPACPDCTEIRTEYFTAGTEPVLICDPLAPVGEAILSGWEKLTQLLGGGE